MDHEEIKEKLIEFYDGFAPSEIRSLIQYHVEGCEECRTQLDRWKQISKAYLQPLQVGYSEAFVQEVMRNVRRFAPLRESIRWPLFARWAIPALALSATSFAAVFAYTTQRAALSTDTLLTEDANPGLSAGLALDTLNEDQILGLTGEEQ